MRQSSGGCVRGAKSPPRVQSNRGLSQNDLEKSIEAAPLFTAKLKADRLKTQKTAHEN